VDVLGKHEIIDITPDDVDSAMVQLAGRGRLKGGRMVTTPLGKPLAGSTTNRYLSHLRVAA
jgi:hypothetical protein